MTLEKLVQIEAADQQANVIEGTVKNSHTIPMAPKVNLVKQGYRHGKPIQKFRKKDKYMKTGSGKNSHDKSQILGGKNCTRCGKPGHNYTQLDKCPANNRKCSACGKLGHFRQFCRSSNKVCQASEITEQGLHPRKPLQTLQTVIP